MALSLTTYTTKGHYLRHKFRQEMYVFGFKCACYLNLKPPIYFEEKHREPKENTVFVMGCSRAPKSQFYSLLCNVKLHLPIAQVKLRLEFISPIAKAKFTSPGHDFLCRLNSILSYMVGVFI